MALFDINPELNTPLQRISIVVCTHERPADLARCLDALIPLAEMGHEVIIVDNAPTTARTAEIVVRYPFRYVDEPTKGLNQARNRGLYAASHPIVAFTDDDAVPDVNWAAAIAQPFAGPTVGCVTGLVLPLELETPAQQQFEIYCQHRRIFEPQRFSAPQTPPSTGGVVGMGANMAVRRELVLELGGFDPRLDGGTTTLSGGDTDMFTRILESGAEIVYTPEAVVHHHHRREWPALQYCVFGYGVGLYSFLTKRVIEARDARALITAVRWFGGPLVKAAWRRLRGQPTVSLDLLLLEAAGACLGPWRFWRANKAAARLRKNSTESIEDPKQEERFYVQTDKSIRH